MKYNLIQIEKSGYQQWDKLVDQSKEGTIFHKSIFLNSMNINFKIFYIMKGREPVAGVTLSIEPLNKTKATLQDCLIYNGLIFFNTDNSSSNVSKIHSQQFEITEFVVKELTKMYKTLEFQMSPSIKDIRPFLWLNYHSNDTNKKFNVDVRYTSILNIDEINDTDILNDNKCFRQFGSSRRQEIRYGITNKVKVFQSNNVEKFFSLYRETMKDSSEPDNLQKILKTTKNIVEGTQNEKVLKVYYALNYSEEIASSVLFCWDLKRAYYLFGANNRCKDERYIGSYILWEAFKDLRNSGIKEIDLEGVNSPDRGWFKLSFGGDLSPYYRLRLLGGSK